MDDSAERWCPACRHTQAYGEFCQTCGGRLTTEPERRRSDLVDPGIELSDMVLPEQRGKVATQLSGLLNVWMKAAGLGNDLALGIRQLVG